MNRPIPLAPRCVQMPENFLRALGNRGSRASAAMGCRESGLARQLRRGPCSVQGKARLIELPKRREVKARVHAPLHQQVLRCMRISRSYSIE